MTISFASLVATGTCLRCFPKIIQYPPPQMYDFKWSYGYHNVLFCDHWVKVGNKHSVALNWTHYIRYGYWCYLQICQVNNYIVRLSRAVTVLNNIVTRRNNKAESIVMY